MRHYRGARASQLIAETTFINAIFAAALEENYVLQWPVRKLEVAAVWQWTAISVWQRPSPKRRWRIERRRIRIARSRSVHKRWTCCGHSSSYVSGWHDLGTQLAQQQKYARRPDAGDKHAARTRSAQRGIRTRHRLANTMNSKQGSYLLNHARAGFVNRKHNGTISSAAWMPSVTKFRISNDISRRNSIATLTNSYRTKAESTNRSQFRPR